MALRTQAEVATGDTTWSRVVGLCLRLRGKQGRREAHGRRSLRSDSGQAPSRGYTGQDGGTKGHAWRCGSFWERVVEIHAVMRGNHCEGVARFLDKLGMTDYLVGSDGGNLGYEQDG